MRPEVQEPRFEVSQSVSINEPGGSYSSSYLNDTSFVAEYIVTIREHNHEKARELHERFRLGESPVEVGLYDFKQNKLISAKEYLDSNKELDVLGISNGENWSWSVKLANANYGLYDYSLTFSYCLTVYFDGKEELLKLIELYMDKELFQAQNQEFFKNPGLSDEDIDDALKDIW